MPWAYYSIHLACLCCLLPAPRWTAPGTWQRVSQWNSSNSLLLDSLFFSTHCTLHGTSLVARCLPTRLTTGTAWCACMQTYTSVYRIIEMCPYKILFELHRYVCSRGAIIHVFIELKLFIMYKRSPAVWHYLWARVVMYILTACAVKWINIRMHASWPWTGW